MKRHKSVGKFVQKSQTKAEVKITICNNDNDPFKRDVYGDCIIFERILYANGLSVYSIKNESSIVVCTGSKNFYYKLKYIKCCILYLCSLTK